MEKVTYIDKISDEQDDSYNPNILQFIEKLPKEDAIQQLIDVIQSFYPIEIKCQAFDKIGELDIELYREYIYRLKNISEVSVFSKTYEQLFCHALNVDSTFLSFYEKLSFIEGIIISSQNRDVGYEKLYELCCVSKKISSDMIYLLMTSDKYVNDQGIDLIYNKIILSYEKSGYNLLSHLPERCNEKLEELFEKENLDAYKQLHIQLLQKITNTIESIPDLTTKLLTYQIVTNYKLRKEMDLLRTHLFSLVEYLSDVPQKVKIYDTLANCSDEVAEKERINKLILKLGYNKNRQDIFGNSQNIHSKGVMVSFQENIEVLKNVIAALGITTRPFDDCLAELKICVDDHPSLQFISYDMTQYYGLTTQNIFCMLCSYALSKDEVYTDLFRDRLVEELKEMSDSTKNTGCSSGYVVRLINVLTGYYDSLLDFTWKGIQISLEDDMIVKVRHYIIETIKKEEKADLILEQMTRDKDQKEYNEFLIKLIPTMRQHLKEKHYNDLQNEEFETLLKLAIDVFLHK